LNDGLSDTSPFETFERGMSELGPDVSVLLKRGDTIPVPTGATVGATGGEVGAYGTGDRPVVLIRESDGVLNLAGSGWTVNDCVITFGDGVVRTAPAKALRIYTGTTAPVRFVDLTGRTTHVVPALPGAQLAAGVYVGTAGRLAMPRR
jgi:hypothetical protein